MISWQQEKILQNAQQLMAPIQGGAADLIKNAMYDIYIFKKK